MRLEAIHWNPHSSWSTRPSAGGNYPRELRQSITNSTNLFDVLAVNNFCPNATALNILAR